MDAYTLMKELENARDAVAGLESELKEERSRLRALTTEQGRFERRKHDVLLQLQRTESVSSCLFLFHLASDCHRRIWKTLKLACRGRRRRTNIWRLNCEVRDFP